MRTTVPSVRTIVFVCTFFLSSLSYSQSVILGNGKTEIGIGVGPSFFLGDLGGNVGADKTSQKPGGLKHLNFPVTKLAKGAFVAVYPKPWLGFRLGVNHTVLEGDDALIPDGEGDEQYRKRRNLNFKTNAFEGHLLAEIYPRGFFAADQEDLIGLQPYFTAGLGAYKVNPKTRINGARGEEWVALNPLMLEGHGMEEFPDRKKYGNIVPSLNFGAGFKFYFGGNKFVGFEMLHRSSKGAGADMIDGVSTDYIDPFLFDKYLSPANAAVANQLFFREKELANNPLNRQNPQVGEQRGDPTENDSWFSSIIRFGWRLQDPNSPGGRSARQMRCPSFY
jgi:hypothetical protein